MSYFGIEKKDLPRSAIVDMSVEGSMKKYHFTGSKVPIISIFITQVFFFKTKVLLMVVLGEIGKRKKT